ncbi:MAG: ketosteroid isomerase family protein [Mycolicibacterium sp.]|uniref:nuclear transport factor 2 family protein n=1 Tax=Mycolicibacterium sp. TaxID=2320850 RepID=UPI003D0C51E4
MGATRAELLATARRSLTAAGAHDRAGWLGLFTDDGCVRDPVGSRPHHGRVAIGHFYDTFIGPRDIGHHPHIDIVTDETVVRDLELEIQMASNLIMKVPTYIRYDLRAESGELRIAGLSAYWELPAMIRRYLRGGFGALPAGIALGRAMLTNQGLSGSLGFISGLRGLGSAGKALFGRLLDETCGGDEIGLRRLAADIPITLGDAEPLSTSDLIKHLSGGTWHKMIRSGRAVAARVDNNGEPFVLIGDLAADPTAISRIRLFGEIR